MKVNIKGETILAISFSSNCPADSVQLSCLNTSGKPDLFTNQYGELMVICGKTCKPVKRNCLHISVQCLFWLSHNCYNKLHTISTQKLQINCFHSARLQNLLNAFQNTKWSSSNYLSIFQ